MGLLIAYRGVRPRLAPDVFVAENAVITGDVEIGPGSSIWYGVAIRGDSAPIRIGARVNVQDNSVIHADADAPVTIADDVTIGHRAIVHGATIGHGTLIGMGAILLSRSTIGAGAVVGAGALVVEDATVADGELALGAPARSRRNVTVAESEDLLRVAQHYYQLSREYLAEQQGRARGEP